MQFHKTAIQQVVIFIYKFPGVLNITVLIDFIKRMVVDHICYLRFFFLNIHNNLIYPVSITCDPVRHRSENLLKCKCRRFREILNRLDPAK